MSGLPGSSGQRNPNAPNRSGGAINIHPSQVQQLVQVLKNEVQLGKNASDETEKKKHYAKAEGIRTLLLNYQAQQRARSQQQQNQQNQNQNQNQSQQNQIHSSQSPMAMNLSQQSRQPSSQPTPVLQSPQLSSQQMRSGSAGSQGSPAPIAGTPSIPANMATVERFNIVKQKLTEVQHRIQFLEQSKKGSNIGPDELATIDKELLEQKTKFSQFQKLGLFIRNSLTQQAQARANTPQAATGTPPQFQPQQQQQQMQQQQQPASITSAGQAQKPTGSRPPSTAHSQSTPSFSAKSVSPAPATGDKSSPKSTTPQKSQSLRTPGPPPINLAGITKPQVPSIPISATINVKPPTAVTLKATGDSRPTLTGGEANSLSILLNTPAITKLPTFELSSGGTNGSLPETGQRALTKRKLSELISTMGVDEGDGKTNIDGNVEELLLDLADEFINSVTSFSCRLAKHRKVDSIDTKDVQLHLERNWNIKIPGYAMDEIRSTRKLQPSTSYNQKVQGVEISRSVNGDING
ncbi:Transcription initiation factor TFIID subunit 12 (TBP-associated factor 12) (TBP-associated factor 61 kDa) (TAFII-61) (TAFII61) (TAFII-68) (TAFII68) [Scheffersomyces stipitis CBS 6054]|uniref:TBP-associated factor 12 n=1 Tax=Scheffersomyces stipitis (strain ATCC 58785 / CBS 6054 / NBRC 10063 / NRRL Y-11545) TaxID=322104 RepID=A3M0B4_PICST|nr:Transcription initiation factor TFIID subunit 12 (TBP-associated factor 12) (TBP-associated factor 61 kDa) (TAFII-61) (TAFII61) (TAFII-68) (TAFII68) [Scheffersomyces stipitis CBS 6054]ABN68491.2 Transcription initiation factor TFIID subunit 12 (TBP-associated factor 12) (TBP-associated factor 61 kDa) (TAFII-61) (TAFII61) (TAFII-68) (TAFII68) [Scheffersomyces stipitis CBS 6054]